MKTADAFCFLLYSRYTVDVLPFKMKNKLNSSDKLNNNIKLDRSANELNSRTFAIVDVETTGASPMFDRVIEIGIVRVENGTVVQTFQTLINPQKSLPPSITLMTGIAPGELETAPVFEDVAHTVAELLSGAIFVAHNARFDYGFLKNEFKRAGLPFSAKCLCTVRLSRKLFPEHRHHDLSSVIDRFGFSCERRHRAYDDAAVLWEFLTHIQNSGRNEELGHAIDTLIKGSSLPPFLDEATVDALSDGPGVYLFYGAEDELLYVGKSRSLRTRILSHFSGDHAASKEMNVSQQTVRVETRETPGELSALLLESTLVKQLNPLYNRQLRRKKELIVARLIETESYPSVELVRTGEINPADYERTMGIFRNMTQAKSFLRDAVMDHALCPRVMGLEKGSGECFYRQLGKCNGACIGTEGKEAYADRLALAFKERRIKAWPYAGPIMISERESDEAAHSYVLDNWCLIADVLHDTDTTQHNTYTPQFDYDSYKIFARYLRNPLHKKYIRPLSVRELRSMLSEEAVDEPTIVVD